MIQVRQAGGRFRLLTPRGKYDNLDMLFIGISQSLCRSDGGPTPRKDAPCCKILRSREYLFAQLDRLPHCLCHHDAFRRNLLARDGDNGAQTVAIDWATLGLGAVGEEIGVTTQVNLGWLEMGNLAPDEVDGAIFEGYLDGLRAAGWQGDARLARLGYTATVALMLAGNAVMGAPLWEDVNVPFCEAVIGHPIDDIGENFARVGPFLFGMGDEALALAETV